MLGCIIQARMGSTRLPGKVMKLLDGKNPSLSYTINQLQNCKGIDKIIVATTLNNEDDVIVNYLQNSGICFFRGSATDVLDRYYKCAKKLSLSSIIRVTADCPLIDPLIVDKGITIFQSGKYDYVSNTFPRTYPDGNETELFSYEALENAWENAILPSEREHVTSYLRNNKEKFKIKNFKHINDISHLRWTVDYSEDYELVKTIISKISSRPFHLESILDLLKSQPELIEINKGHKPDEGLIRSFEEDKKFLIKQKF